MNAALPHEFIELMQSGLPIKFPYIATNTVASNQAMGSINRITI
jgi:hypothetical protein